MNIHPLATLLLSAVVLLASCGKDEEPDNEMPNPPPPAEVECNPSSAGQEVTAVPAGDFVAKFTATPITVDGCIKDEAWANASWHSLNYPWMGSTPDAADYTGKFKLLWDANYLYVFVEVTDDVLNPTLANGMENYWKGDYVEVFLDEDQSGGEHRYNHQAFAYHVSTEGHAIDLNTQQEAVFFDDHVTVAREQDGNTYYWELAIAVYNDQFDENSTSNTPETLAAQKTLGFSLAYGDNDGSNTRENFMGSRESHGVNNDEGYVNADVFGSVLLTE